MALTLVPVTGQVDIPTGAAGAAAEVSFMPNAAMINAADRIVLQHRTTVETELDGTLPAGLALYATDDPGVQPDGLAYTITIRRPPHANTTVLALNVSHLAASVDISDATPALPAPVPAYASQAALTGYVKGAVVDAGGAPQPTLRAVLKLDALGELDDIVIEEL